jgi:hypothetical protein
VEQAGSATEVEVNPADSGRARAEFLEFPYSLYRDDPAFVPPLRLERREQLDPGKNAFFGHAEVALFIARRQGRPTGRISAQLDREEQRTSGIRGATFGLFEAADGETAAALLAEVERWARARGAVRLRGPFSLSINQESGLLVDGFDVPPMLLMPHGRREYSGYLDQAHFAKARDLYVWRVKLAGVPPGLRRAADRARATPGLTVRPLELGRLGAELVKVRAVFNSAWSQNWGFVPLTDAELQAMARDLRFLADPRIALLAEVDGEAKGIAIALPDLNQAIAGLGGALLPFGWCRLLWRLKVRGLTRARLALFGVVEAFRGVAGLGLTALLLSELHDRGLAAGYTGDWEISWVLEDNRTANEAARMMGAVRVKTYRVYEKALG